MKIKDINEEAYTWLMDIPLGHWARHSFDPTPHIDHCTNNLSECFNAWVDPIRGYSFLNIMEVFEFQFTNNISFLLLLSVLHLLTCFLFAGCEGA